MRARLLVGLAVLMLVGLLVVWSPIQIPYSIDVPGKVMAAQEWVVSKRQDGHLESALRDHAKGRVHSYAVRHLERGDEARFELHPGIAPGAGVEAGDTLGWFYSNETERQWVQLQGELASAAATLDLSRAGKKEAVVREVRERLFLAQSQLAQQQRQAARLQALLAQNMASAEEVEIAQHTARLYALQVEIAQAQLEAMQTGAREEQVELARVRLEGLRREKEVMAKRQAGATLLTPLSGKVCSSFSADTLVMVQDTSCFALFLPVKWGYRGLIAPGQAVELYTDKGSLSGTIERLDSAPRLLEGQQVFFAVALVEDPGEHLASGLIVRCAISCAPVSLWEYLRQFLGGWAR